LIKKAIIGLWVAINVIFMFYTGGFYSVFIDHGLEYVLGKWVAFLVILGGGIIFINFIAKKIQQRKEKQPESK
jgi:hypothetical protein